jgi:hypothetical protein
MHQTFTTGISNLPSVDPQTRMSAPPAIDSIGIEIRTGGAGFSLPEMSSHPCELFPQTEVCATHLTWTNSCRRDRVIAAGASPLAPRRFRYLFATRANLSDITNLQSQPGGCSHNRIIHWRETSCGSERLLATNYRRRNNARHSTQRSIKMSFHTRKRARSKPHPKRCDENKTGHSAKPPVPMFHLRKSPQPTPRTLTGALTTNGLRRRASTQPRPPRS